MRWFQGPIKPLILVWLNVTPLVAIAGVIPECRLDHSNNNLVLKTINRAAQTYKEVGKALPFDSVVINRSNNNPTERVLSVYIISEASISSVDANGCATRPVALGEKLDPITVQDGCLIDGINSLEMRCSSRAVALFGNTGNKEGRENPSLLYVLAHELGHVYQREPGKYAGQSLRFDLSQPRKVKLQALKDACEPSFTFREENADALALEVMKKLLPKSPYSEPVFSQQGSLLWNVDQLAIAADEWRRASLELRFESRQEIHKSFIPTEFPQSKSTIIENATIFVCDVLSKNSGEIHYPLQTGTHPSMDQRLGRAAKELKPVADSLPNDTQNLRFGEIARLQLDLSPVSSHIYRETAVYMEEIQNHICSTVNSPDPLKCP